MLGAIFADWNATTTILVVIGLWLGRMIDDIRVMLSNIEADVQNIDTNTDR